MTIAPIKAVLLTGAELSLAACNTTSERQAAMPPPPSQALAMVPPADVTGSIEAAKPTPADSAPERPKASEASPAPFLPGDEPAASGAAAAAIAEGRAAYRANHFREAERLFRKATQSDARSSEAWLGLAASADRLRDFTQADKAYGKAREIAGPTSEILNNQGYSYILRGDLKRARASLTAAKRLDPNNKYVENNLSLLAANESKEKR